MKKLTKAIGITAALAVMIPLSAYAATTPGTSSAQPSVETKTHATADKTFKERGFVSQEVLDLLKLDQTSLKAKIDAGKTLAQIAQEQGVSRDQLKQAMTDAFNKKLDESKKKFADNLDKMLDRQPTKDKDHKDGEKGAFFKKNLDSSAVATILGVSSDELKQSRASGKSLADLAKEKSVDVQKLIDAEKNAIIASINQAVKDGMITQQQADKQIENAAAFAEKFVNGKHDFKRNGVHSHKQAETKSGS